MQTDRQADRQTGRQTKHREDQSALPGIKLGLDDVESLDSRPLNRPVAEKHKARRPARLGLAVEALGEVSLGREVDLRVLVAQHAVDLVVERVGLDLMYAVYVRFIWGLSEVCQVSLRSLCGLSEVYLRFVRSLCGLSAVYQRFI